MGLAISRRNGGSIVLEWGDEQVVVTVVRTDAAVTRLAIDAPQSVNVRRDELPPR